MKLLSKIMTVFVLCAGLTQIVGLAKIKIAKQNPTAHKGPWTYYLETRTMQLSGAEKSPLKKLKKSATISFNPNDLEVEVVVQTDKGEKRRVLKKDTDIFYTGKGILVDSTGRPILIDNNEAPFAPTHTIAVQKQNSDGKEWTIKAVNPPADTNPINFEYGEVKIKNSTNPGKGIVVPKNKDFTLHVEIGSKPNKWVTSNFTAEQASHLKKIIIDGEGKATPA